MGTGSFVYKAVLFIHLVTVVVGFGSAFVWTMLGARARSEPAAGGALLSRTGVGGISKLSAPAIWVAGVSGFLLVLLHVIDDDGFIEFSETWISIGFLLFFIAAGVTQFLWLPAQRRVDDLLQRLAGLPAGSARPDSELAELEERGKQVAIWSGVVHLSFVLLMIDMIWKPGA